MLFDLSNLKKKLFNTDTLGWSNFSKSSQIEPPFLYSMCMGDTRSHTKFQVSSLNILEWRPLFVNWSWHWRSHLKWPERGTFDLAPFKGIKNALQNGITLGVLDFRKYVKRLVKIAKITIFLSGCFWYFYMHYP